MVLQKLAAAMVNNHGGGCKLQTDMIGAKQINVCEDIHNRL
jgi:hypothetical protein